MDIFSTIGTWFGYVGACVATPDATCRPLLAFVAMGAAAAIALALLLYGYGSAQRRETAATARRATGSDAQPRSPLGAASKGAVEPTLAGRLTPVA